MCRLKHFAVRVTGTAATAELLQQPLFYVVTRVAHELDALKVAE